MPKLKQKEISTIIKYLVSGGAWFWSGYIAFFIFDKFFGLNLFAAKMGANVIGWSINFVLQRYWAFKNPALSKHKQEVTERYILITLVQFGLDYLIVAGLNNAGLTPYIGQFLAAGFFTFWNYFWYRFFVFNKKIRSSRAM